MLILYRKIGQRVLVNEGSMLIKIMDVIGDTVRIGFDAPKGMDIDREEIYAKKLAQKRKLTQPVL